MLVSTKPRGETKLQNIRLGTRRAGQLQGRDLAWSGVGRDEPRTGLRQALRRGTASGARRTDDAKGT